MEDEHIEVILIVRKLASTKITIHNNVILKYSTVLSSYTKMCEKFMWSLKFIPYSWRLVFLEILHYVLVTPTFCISSAPFLTNIQLLKYLFINTSSSSSYMYTMHGGISYVGLPFYWHDILSGASVLCSNGIQLFSSTLGYTKQCWKLITWLLY